MSFEEAKKIIKAMIKQNNKVSRKDISIKLGVSEKTITRYINEIPSIKYVGWGKYGHWIISQNVPQDVSQNV
ncbi:HTH domain-containing protein, partial [Mycoplasmopsis anatis]